MTSMLGLSAPAKYGLARSVRTTSFSTTHCTLRKKSSCSSPDKDLRFSLEREEDKIYIEY